MSDRSSAHILLIEDTPTLAQTYQSDLTSAGYHVTCADTTNAALQ